MHPVGKATYLRTGTTQRTVAAAFGRRARRMKTEIFPSILIALAPQGNVCSVEYTETGNGSSQKSGKPKCGV